MQINYTCGEKKKVRESEIGVTRINQYDTYLIAAQSDILEEKKRERVGERVRERKREGEREGDREWVREI